MTLTESVQIDELAILRSLKLDPRDPKAQAAVLICSRYGLDPVLAHVVLIEGKPYITRDGYVHLAHASGVFDGVIVDQTGQTDDEWWARVSVYRRDMTHPFTYVGRYPKNGSNRKFGPEMAIKVGEVAAFRRAFDVTGVGAADERWDVEPDYVEPSAGAPVVELSAPAEPEPDDRVPVAYAKGQLMAAYDGDKVKAKAAWQDWWGGDGPDGSISRGDLSELLDSVRDTADAGLAATASAVPVGGEPDGVDTGTNALPGEPARLPLAASLSKAELRPTLYHYAALAARTDDRQAQRDLRIAVARALGYDIDSTVDMGDDELRDLINALRDLAEGSVELRDGQLVSMRLVDVETGEVL